MDTQAEESVVVGWTGTGPVTRGPGGSGRAVRGVPAAAAAAADELRWQGFDGAPGATALDAERGLLVGLGPRGDWIESVRVAAEAVGRMAAFPVELDLSAIPTSGHAGSAAALLQAAATGLTVGLGDREIPVAVVVPQGLREGDQAAAAVADGRAVGAGIRLARSWTNQSGAEFTPEVAAARISALAAENGLHCKVFQGQELERLGCGALSGIGAGSPHPPAMVELEYRPDPAVASIALVGKGITFDTGGLSVKSAAAMTGMRMDMAGAAAVVGAVLAAARRELPVRVRAVLPFAENMIGPHGLRPGDVVTAANGKRIQVLDTDFEGRVVMADALSLAARSGPDAVVDIATLTYQAEIALGAEIGAVMARDTRLGEAVLAAAERAGEPMWALPWATRYAAQISSEVAEVRNHPGSDVGRALTAGLFLGEFVPPETPFAHLDMAGPAWAGPASGQGATGFGVASLFELVRGLDRPPHRP